MKKLFEYFYYRIAKLNFKENRPERAVISVSIVQFLVIANVLIGIYLAFFSETKRKFNTYEIIIFLVLFFGLDYYNNKRFKGRYKEFDSRWGNEPKKKKIINMIIITLTIILAWGLVFINALLFGRFKTY